VPKVVEEEKIDTHLDQKDGEGLLDAVVQYFWWHLLRQVGSNGEVVAIGLDVD